MTRGELLNAIIAVVHGRATAKGAAGKAEREALLAAAFGAAAMSAVAKLPDDVLLAGLQRLRAKGNREPGEDDA